MKLKASFMVGGSLHQRETVSEGDTGRETIIRLVIDGRDLPSEIESAILRVDGDTVTEIELEENDDGDWQFQWTAGDFVSLPASATEYEAQVKATCEDSTVVYFPTTGVLKIKVNEPI